MRRNYTRGPVPVRFMVKVNRDEPPPPHCPEVGTCWAWTASRYHDGYGKFYDGRRMRAAHIVAYELFVGPTNGLQVLHRCDVKHCVRPGHLFLGTQKDNVQDMLAKGRGPSGERNGAYTRPETRHTGDRQWQTRLTDDDVREIRRFAAAGVAQHELARWVNAHPSTISLIVSRKTWKHVP